MSDTNSSQQSRIDILADRIKNSTDLATRIKENPVDEITKLIEEIKRQNPMRVTPIEDRFTFRMCVMVLSIIVMFVVGLVGVKYYGFSEVNEHKFFVPEILVAIGSTALGALAGLLSPQAFRDR